VPGRTASSADKLRIVVAALLAVTVIVHARDLSTPGLLDSSGRLKASDFMRLYTTGAIAAERRWDGLFDASTHVAVARARIDPRLEMRGLHPNYGPTAAWLLSPFSRLPFLPAWTVFCLLTTSVLLIGLWLLAGEAPSTRPYRGLVLLAALACPALIETVRYGQLSAFTAGLFALAATLDARGRPFAAGVALGLLVYKPYLLLPALLIWALAGRRYAALGAVVGAAAHICAGIVVGGWPVTLRWVEVLAALGRNPELVQGFPNEVHSFAGFVRLLGLNPTLATGIATAGGLVAIAAALAVWRRTKNLSRRWSALILATVLVAPHLITYDLLLLAPALLLAVQSQLGHQRTTRVVVAGLYFAPLISPLAAAISGVQISTLLMAVMLGLIALDLPSRQHLPDTADGDREQEQTAEGKHP
jgi:hypothetical protein